MEGDARLSRPKAEENTWSPTFARRSVAKPPQIKK
ncbi:hypothetical protein F-liban_89 [Faustovirus]|nr:hypothetical protein F-liban_89 [Faustovirus]